MSLFQNYKGDLIRRGARTDAQQRLFNRCMNSMQLWYGNAHIDIWMMTKSAPSTEREYDDRGWCQFEKRVGGIITPAHMTLDLGRIRENFSSYDQTFWDGNSDAFADSCSAERELPMLPESFDKDILPNLQFSQEKDRAVISGLYAKTFEGVIGCAKELSWRGVGWSFEVRKLEPLLLKATGTLRSLALGRNKFSGGCTPRSSRRRD